MTESISERIRIYVDETKTFNIVDMKNNIIIFFGIKDLDTAIGIRKAYCLGYNDRKTEEEQNNYVLLKKWGLGNEK